MEYFVFEEKERLLHLRDGITSTVNRISLKVNAFEIRDGYYRFEFEKHETLGFKRFHMPIQNTFLSVV